MVSRLLKAALLMCAAALAIPAGAAASTTCDLRGDWNDQNSYGYTAQFTISTEDLSTGQFSGTFGTNATLSGTINGFSYTETIKDNASSYHSQLQGSISGNGNTVTGSFKDTNGHQGTYTSTRQSGPPGGQPACGGGSTGGGSTGGGSTGGGSTGGGSTGGGSGGGPSSGPAATAMQVTCTYRYATFDFLCTVIVAPASGSGAPPTGVVSLSATKGGFANGSACTLTPKGSGSYCTVVYDPPASGLPSGSPVPVSASYGGNNSFKASSSSASLIGAPAGGIPGVPPQVAPPTPNQTNPVQLQVTCPLYVACAPATIVTTPSSAGVPTPSSAGVPGPSSIGAGGQSSGGAPNGPSSAGSQGASSGGAANGPSSAGAARAGARATLLAKVTVALGPRSSKRVRVRLNRRGQKLLRRAPHHRLTVRVTVFGSGRMLTTRLVKVRR